MKEGQSAPFKEVGEPVLCGSIIRLSHLETDRNLHSHLFSSPLSNQQEVSCFGGKGQGDTGDDFVSGWVVVEYDRVREGR